ncbi:MAG: DNA alkylation repair protein [Gammaproteobacteria bacterium]|nr:DNA alkylation repair protein [Gammaproteobacteria bacterium]
MWNFAIALLLRAFHALKQNIVISNLFDPDLIRGSLKHTKYINNWDLVDSSAHYIVGVWLNDKDRSVLYALAQSKQLWERRIAIMSTFYFIKNAQFSDTLKLSKILINDREDLVHKAVGWMLREIGNRDIEVEEKYLKQYYKKMPGTMLRYSIEKFSKERRQAYLKGEI